MGIHIAIPRHLWRKKTLQAGSTPVRSVMMQEDDLDHLFQHHCPTRKNIKRNGLLGLFHR